MALVPVTAWRKARRNAWLTRRRTDGKTRPLPLVTMTVNCMSISTGPKHAAQILRNAAAWRTEDGRPVDVIMASECDDFDGHHVLGAEWDVLHDADNGDKDGCLLAVRKARGTLRRPHYVLAARAFPGGMRDRYLATVVVELDFGTRHRWTPRVAAGHAPPMRAWVRWPGYMNSVARLHSDFVGSDWNKLGRAVLPALRRRVSMVGILGLASRWWIPTGPPIPVDVGGDHMAVAVVLWPAVKPYRKEKK